MRKAKVIAIGSGAQNVVKNRKAQKLFDVFAIDCKEGCGNDVEMSEQKENTPMSKFFGIIDNEIYRHIEMHVRKSHWWTRLLNVI